VAGGDGGLGGKRCMRKTSCVCLPLSLGSLRAVVI